MPKVTSDDRFERREYLVVRAEAIQNSGNRRLQSSECWPAIVWAKGAVDAVDEVYRQYFGESSYTGQTNRAFLVIALNGGDAVWVRYRKPEPKFDIEIKPYESR